MCLYFYIDAQISARELLRSERRVEIRFVVQRPGSIWVLLSAGLGAASYLIRGHLGTFPVPKMEVLP